MRRVAVTGIGVISAIGKNRIEFEQSLREGRCGMIPLTDPAHREFRFRNGAEVTGFNAADHFGLKEADMMDRFAQFAVVAAREAVAHSGLEWTEELRENSAIVTGSCIGGQATEDQGFFDVYKMGKPRVHPMTIPKTMANAGASAISLEFGITGPAFTIATACSSSAHAIGQAFHMVRSGMCDVAITGGSEAPFSYGVLKAWEAMRVVSPDVCRPFSRDRNGMILGEGAAMLVVEALDHAEARGARPVAEIVGFGMSSDAHHITQPSAEGAAKAMRMALKDAAIVPEQIGYVNAHGTGTLVNDPTETRALHLAFGEHVRRLAISSTKAMHGHTLGAAGAIESSAAILALATGILPATIHFTAADPECDLDCIPNSARLARVEYALSNSFAFGGLNAVLAFKALSA
ncbi:MAG TPA: beta-ketoacyl-[acyl-carrier-protein] synthase family protein [Bryobacteraceae bacterium]|jgi:nodulation protein E|nr:beta-ketoacyl-[acyl-carrier-protein] synthase family protein [Bryobacteraceae bacterium]